VPGGSAAFIPPGEEPVPWSDGDSPQASLGAVVVDLQVSSLATVEEGLAVSLTHYMHASRSTGNPTDLFSWTPKIQLFMSTVPELRKTTFISTRVTDVPETALCCATLAEARNLWHLTFLVGGALWLKRSPRGWPERACWLEAVRIVGKALPGRGLGGKTSVLLRQPSESHGESANRSEHR
jgi:hypothetical protein